MMLPLPCLYICFRAARVVRKAPSRWMASSFFQSSNLNSSSGATIWMPALLTRVSRAPNFSIALATPASTPASSTTFMATPMAVAPVGSSSFAAASAPSRFRSAITTLAPSR